MKIALISDVHGNYPALLAVFERIRKENCDLIISLGDIAGYYCMVNECIKLCRDNNVVNVLGNHDYYLITNTKCPRSATANICIEFQKKVITSENLEWLQTSIPEYRNLGYWFVHGGWNNPLDEYIESFDFSIMGDCGARLFASGHTHIQKVQRKGNLIYVNPGSIGQPRDGDWKAAFAIIESTGEVSIYREKYDVDRIAHAMKKNGFKTRLYEGLYNGTRIQPFYGSKSQ